MLVIFASWRSASSVIGAAACLAASALYGVLFVYGPISRQRRHESDCAVHRTAQRCHRPVNVCLGESVGGSRNCAQTRWAALLCSECWVPGIAYILNYRLITDDGLTVVSTVTYLIPVAAVLFGMITLGESLGLRVLAGMVIVFAGVGLVRRTAHPPRPVAVPDALVDVCSPGR